MTPPLKEARSALHKARQALLRDDRRQARQWAERAARLAPQLEDPWLVLAAVAGPRHRLEYIQRALQVNPGSARARRGMEWVMQRLQDPKAAYTQQSPSGSVRRTQPNPAPSRRRPAIAVALLALGCVILGFAGWSASTSPIIASILPRPALASGVTNASSWAHVSVPKPTYTPVGSEVGPSSPGALSTAESPPASPTDPPELSTPLSTDLPTDFPTSTPPPGTPTPQPTWSGSFSLEYVPDTPTPEIPDFASPPPLVEPGTGMAPGGEHWIDVDLTQQMVYARVGTAVINSFVVSTGTWLTPTVTGEYKIYVKLRYSDMAGADYYFPDVPYVMFFYKDYGLHGTYWHNNFGTPMSHGCVNLSVPDAEWLYNFSDVGTAVSVHY